MENKEPSITKADIEEWTRQLRENRLPETQHIHITNDTVFFNGPSVYGSCSKELWNQLLIEDANKYRISIPDSTAIFEYMVAAGAKYGDYYHLPYYFKKKDDGSLEVYSFEHLPDYVKKMIDESNNSGG